MKRLFLAETLGMCDGVRLALSALDQLLAGPDCRAAALHEPVHNKFITDGLKKRGLRLISAPAEVAPGETLVIGAHGAAPELYAEIRRRQIKHLDTTCPLVLRLQKAAAALPPDAELIWFGETGHPEAVGVLGQLHGQSVYAVKTAADVEKLPLNLKRPVMLAQTTGNFQTVEEVSRLLQQRYGNMTIGPRPCRASQQRQTAVRRLASAVQLVIVVGSPQSANAGRLREAAVEEGTAAILIGSAAELPPPENEIFSGVENVGLTAGASTPDVLIEEVKQLLASPRYGFLPA